MGKMNILKRLQNFFGNDSPAAKGKVYGTISARVIRANGQVEDLGEIYNSRKDIKNGKS